MPRYWFCICALTAGWAMLALPTHGQNSRPPSQTSRGYQRPPSAIRPSVVPSARPTVVTPARPSVAPSVRPAVPYPTRPTVVVTPARPPTTYPVRPGGVVVRPAPQVIIVPSYPSAYIGPEVVRVTTSPSMATALPAAPRPTYSPGIPAAPANPAAVPRLVAILGKIQRQQTSPTGAAAGDGDHLCVGVGTVVSYHSLEEDVPDHAAARGTYFGSRWDGDRWHTSASGTWTRTLSTSHPLLSLNELSPAPWPFEVARPEGRVTAVRIGLALVNDEDAQSRAPSTPSVSQDRYATMAATLGAGLSRDASLPTPVRSSSSEQSLGEAVFGGLIEVMGGSATTVRSIGAVEWTLSLADLRNIMATCPRFSTVPQPADVVSLSTRKQPGQPPAWVLSFRMEAPQTAVGAAGVVYEGEIWFLIVPDAALAKWQETGAGTGG